MLLKTTDDKTEIVLAQWQTCVELRIQLVNEEIR